MNDQLTTALYAIENFIGDNPDERQQLVSAKCRGLLCGYHARWKSAGYVPYDIERTLVADLVNPDSERKSRSFINAGKRDVAAWSPTKRRTLIDHKTTSLDISDPNSPYWRQLVIEGQVSQYMLLSWQHGEKFDDAMWDVIRKPSISPKKMTKAEQARVVSLGDYYGKGVSFESQEAVKREARETLELYAIRVAHDCTTERPEWYFQRRSVMRIDAEIMDYARELWGHSQDILHTRQANRHVRNPGACMLYGTPCKFLGICSGHDDPDSGRWVRKTKVHAELDLNCDGRDVLTNSRIRCFQTCRKKHYFEYELGLERFDEEEKESLYFGSVLHAGLNAWWSYLLEKQDEHGNESPATGADNRAGESQLAG